jgi:NitT/TauT family transport system permease protein
LKSHFLFIRIYNAVQFLEYLSERRDILRNDRHAFVLNAAFLFINHRIHRCQDEISHQSARLNRVVSPIVYILHPIPKIVFLPILLLFLGIGDTSKVFMIFLILFFPILVVVRDQAGALRPELIYSVRSLGAGRRALFRFVYLPATVPAALTALRVSIGTAVAVLFFAESFATTSGLGYYIIVESWGRLAYPEMYAGVVAMSALGLLLYVAVDRLERRMAPWMFLRDA